MTMLQCINTCFQSRRSGLPVISLTFSRSVRWLFFEVALSRVYSSATTSHNGYPCLQNAWCYSKIITLVIYSIVFMRKRHLTIIIIFASKFCEMKCQTPFNQAIKFYSNRKKYLFTMMENIVQCLTSFQSFFNDIFLGFWLVNNFETSHMYWRSVKY